MRFHGVKSKHAAHWGRVGGREDGRRGWEVGRIGGEGWR